MNPETPANPTPNVPWPQPPYPVRDPRRLSVPLAMVLSSMPGLGQIYLGRYQNGFVNILVVASLIALLNQGVGLMEPLLGLFLAFFWLFNIVDAGRQAHAWNQALAHMNTSDPQALKQDRFGALLTGLGLMGLGLFTLAHRLLGFSMEWVARWWPLALVLVGALLIWKAMRPEPGAAETEA